MIRWLERLRCRLKFTPVAVGTERSFDPDAVPSVAYLLGDNHFSQLWPFRSGNLRRNLFLCALSVSGAIFLIAKLDQPFGGLIQISSAPLRNAVAGIGRLHEQFLTTPLDPSGQTV